MIKREIFAYYLVRIPFPDSQSDNSELSKATKQLEFVLDKIIGTEEQKRTYL